MPQAYTKRVRGDVCDTGQKLYGGKGYTSPMTRAFPSASNPTAFFSHPVNPSCSVSLLPFPGARGTRACSRSPQILTSAFLAFLAFQLVKL